MRLILVHSPLTGPSAWGALPGEIAARGYGCDVVSLPPWSALSRPYLPAMAQHVASGVERGDVVVAHSAAGGLMGAISALAEDRLAEIVFADAILPHPGRCWFETASDALGQALKATVGVEATIPPWDQWFPPGAIAALAPEGPMRDAFLAEIGPTPLAWFEEPAPPLEVVDSVGWSYLRLSKAYEAEAAEARRLGRPTLRLDLTHLAMMTHPAEVASALFQLVRRAG